MNSNFLLTSEIVIKLERIDHVVLTEVPVLIKQEAEVDCDYEEEAKENLKAISNVKEPPKIAQRIFKKAVRKNLKNLPRIDEMFKVTIKQEPELNIKDEKVESEVVEEILIIDDEKGEEEMEIEYEEVTANEDAEVDQKALKDFTEKLKKIPTLAKSFRDDELKLKSSEFDDEKFQGFPGSFKTSPTPNRFVKLTLSHLKSYEKGFKGFSKQDPLHKSLNFLQTMLRNFEEDPGLKYLKPTLQKDQKIFQDTSKKVQTLKLLKPNLKSSFKPSSSLQARLNKISKAINPKSSPKVEKSSTLIKSPPDFDYNMKNIPLKNLSVRLVKLPPQILSGVEYFDTKNESSKNLRPPPQKVFCKLCKVFLSSRQSFKYHNHAYHSNRPKLSFPCHICGRKLHQKNHLKSHLRTHREKNIFSCDICGKSKMTRTSCQRHIMTHKRACYQCDLCEKIFNSKKNMARHVVVHMTVRQLEECPICNQTFKKNTLRFHLLNHRVEKPHKCDICSSTFITNFKLVGHRRIHFNEKPFECSKCDKKFTNKHELKNHFKIYHTDFKIICNECGKRFFSMAGWHEHMKVAHSNSKVECGKCGIEFSSRARLGAHLRHVHDIFLKDLNKAPSDGEN